MAVIGDTVRAHRRAAGLTQDGLADLAGITSRTVRAIETGVSTRPQRRVIAGLSVALGVDLTTAGGSDANQSAARDHTGV